MFPTILLVPGDPWMTDGRLLTNLSQFSGISLDRGLVARVSRSVLLYFMLLEGGEDNSKDDWLVR